MTPRIELESAPRGEPSLLLAGRRRSKQKTPVLGTGKRARLERLPPSRDQLRRASKLLGGIEKGENSRPATCQRGIFGSGPDESALQSRQFWPLSENDPLEVVF